MKCHKVRNLDLISTQSSKQEKEGVNRSPLRYRKGATWKELKAI
jgi:hypothetical protein